MPNDPIKKSKLMILFHNMDEKDFKDLGLWVRSPFHNSSKNVIKLYDVLKSKYHKTGKAIERLDLMKYMEIIPRNAKQKDISPKHKQELRKTMHALTAQIEELFVWKKTQEDTIGCKYQLMEALLERQIYELLSPILNKAKKIHQSSTLRDVKYCKDAYHLAEMDFYMDIASDKRELSTGIKNVMVIETLREFCLSQLLRYYCAIVNSRKVVKIEDDNPFMAVVMEYVKNSGDINSFTIRIYYMLLKVLDGENPDDYFLLKNTLFNQLDAFDTSELKNILSFMFNYCYRMINHNDNRFIEERFDLYVVGMDRGCWMTDSFFSVHNFVQIFRTALLLDKIKWAYSFLDEYGKQLLPDLRSNTLSYCHALSAFNRQRYDEAQEYLNGIDNANDFIYHLGYKILLLKIYYDKNDFNLDNIEDHPINYELEAIKQYVLPSTNKKMSETVRQRTGNFANFFKRILNRKKKIIYKEPLTVGNIETLQTDLADLQPLVERTWLKEKVTELIQEVSGNGK